MNRLQHETSPYLKQHENNPVDWYAWGEEALAAAKQQDKPIVLSVGYSACHWCHVMAHESFENLQIAKIMNDHFINIKVDREERPDLDHIYQGVAQMMTQGGGWPLTVFLTPDLKPFYGGTYFPPTDRYGRHGFARVLMSLAEAYRKNKSDIFDRAEKMASVLSEHEDLKSVSSESAGVIQFSIATARECLITATENLLGTIDWQQGGFGGAPKFPNPMALTFLWRMSQMQWVSSAMRESACEAVHLSLEMMAKGGIFDQLGGGFHRYSVDAMWAVPHFEKMLYDNGLLLKLYSEVALIDRRELYIETIKKTVKYIEREMTSPEGLFYAAQDADSGTPPEEGEFFVWDRAELAPILSHEELEVFCEYFGITEQGNFENGKTVLAQIRSHIAKDKSEILESAERKVFLARAKRAKPGLDDKSLVSWNGLMISGLVWSSLVLKRDLNDEADSKVAHALAVRAYEKIKSITGFKVNATKLCATIQKGSPRFDAYLDDYAFLANAALDLGRIDPKNTTNYIQDANEMLKKIWSDFKDQEGEGFYFSRADQKDLIHRPKSFYDQAIPSGNGVCTSLMTMIEQPLWNDKIEQELLARLPHLEQNPYGFGEMLNALLLKTVGPVLVQGESIESVSNPFCIQESPTGVSGKTQFCHRQVCVLGEFDVQKIYSD